MTLKYEIELRTSPLNAMRNIVYYRHGEQHRIGGPAWFWVGAELSGGWMQYGTYHRDNGPAIGRVTYYCRGELYVSET